MANVNVPWCCLTTEPVDLLCISEAVWWLSHWDTAAGRTRRCAGLHCALCQMGSPRQERAVVMVVTMRGERRLLELRDRHRGELERATGMYGKLAGVWLRCRKSGEARNSPVVVSSVGFERLEAHAIGRLVECLGLPAIVNRDAREATARVEADAIESMLETAQRTFPVEEV